MQINIELDESELRKLVLEKIQKLYGDLPISEEDVKIQTKSKQNWKAEWENAAFRATVQKVC